MTRTKVLELVRRHVPAKGRVLELSCGDGAMLSELSRSGFSVRGTNYSTYAVGDGSVPIDEGIDIRARLPYEDASFDGVILSEVIQNIEGHVEILKEVERVLKPGGVLVLSTPNMMSIKSRLHFLLTGFFKVKWKFIGFDVPLDQAFCFHNHPLHLPVFLYYAHVLGLEAAAIDGAYVKPKSRVLHLLLIWLILPSTWYATHVGETNLAASGASRLLYEALTSKMTLCADRLVLVLRKSGRAAKRAVASELPCWAELLPRSEPR